MKNEKQARDVVRICLERNRDRLDASMREVLAKPIPLPENARVQFELDQFSQGLRICATETEILADDWFNSELPKDLPDELMDDVLEVVNDMIFDWLADSWVRVGGPRQYRPAFAFLHGYRERFDLEQRRWLSVEEAFGK